MTNGNNQNVYFLRLDILFINCLGQLPFRVYNVLGRTVLHLEDVQPEQSISLSKEARPGVYFLQVGTGRKAKHYQFIKVQ